MSKDFTKVERNLLQNDEYKLLSQWTSSQSVEMDSGETLETKMSSVDTSINNEITRAKNAEALKAPIASPILTGTPKAPTASAGTNNTQIATTEFVQTAVSNLVDSAPETLNTLNELSAALGDDPNFATTIANQIGSVESNVTNIIDGTTTVGKATTATKAGTATYATSAGSASKATTCTKAGTATYSTNSGTATYSSDSAKATSATSATYASTANYAKSAPTYKGATTAASGTKGLVPAATTATRTAFLRGDGTWQTPTNTTYNNMTGATSAAAGKAGLVPAPAAGKQAVFLRGDGTWAQPSKATNADTATYAKNAGTASYSSNGAKATSATSATYASTATNAGNATFAGTASFAEGSGFATSATYATNSGTATYSSNGAKASSATSATYASTANYAKSAPTYKGATTAASGTKGLVPAATTATRTSFLRGDGTWTTPTNTKNTAGSTDSSSKLFLIGATSQAANPQTYSHNTAYVGTDGCVYSNSEKTATVGDVLSTVDECTASTTATDIAGASAIAELSDSLSNYIPISISDPNVYISTVTGGYIQIGKIVIFNVKFAFKAGQTGAGATFKTSAFPIPTNACVVPVRYSQTGAIDSYLSLVDGYFQPVGTHVVEGFYAANGVYLIP